MIFRTYRRNLLIRIMLLPVTFSFAAYLYFHHQEFYFFLMLLVLLYQLTDLYRFHFKPFDEMGEFIESVHYRDFSRNFDVRHAGGLRPLRAGFNEIYSELKLISKERETQYQYLQKILELVDTGIILYESETGEVSWMNESLKNILKIPYLKSITSLKKRDESLYNEISTLKPGDSKIAVANPDKDALKILLSGTAFQTGNKKYMLVAFQNVNEALDETESKAWQKLLSVMTHEIMNSVAPISSLAGTLKNRLEAPVEELLEDGAVEDLKLGIDTIKNRSEGLLKFTEIYRSLNKITTLNLSKIYIHELTGNLHHLMLPTLQQKQIGFENILKEPGLSIEGDGNLLEQVLINLLVNAIEALKDTENPHITLTAGLSGRKAFIKVADNGPGMSRDVMDKIFVPFFTTKKNGSGIGLSLSKQIMLLHHGNIQVQSKEGEGTAFVLQF
ncbi:GHKL domain-containing protein [Pedobacter sp. HMF7647]|uniref:histidine kinase n=1 Tax=Hufsiella arboris TaxID=2695275 RepID=A0A7K1YAR5_9SPHI|nr:HAMP domain-containing sensor histidine kinase [Hufsiella arboris]MXV51451.1 GHKL domain-containing protein [Hufsiella arboris]